MFAYMIPETTLKQELQARMDKASKKLKKEADKRTPQFRMMKVYTQIASRLGITAQSVKNYIAGTGGNGYMIEALTKEFMKLPIVDKDELVENN